MTYSNSKERKEACDSNYRVAFQIISHTLLCWDLKAINPPVISPPPPPPPLQVHFTASFLQRRASLYRSPWCYVTLEACSLNVLYPHIKS